MVLQRGKVRRAHLNHGLVHTNNILKPGDLPLEPLSNTMQIGHKFQEIVLHLVSVEQYQWGGPAPTCRVRLAFESLTNVSTRLWRFSANNG